MTVIRNIETPQDVYVIGTDFKGKEEAFSITDDYHTLKVVSGEKEVFLETDGFVFILTKEELLEWKELMSEEPEESSQEGLILKNFSGEIKLKAITEKGEDVLKTFDPKEYVMYQVEIPAGDDWEDVVLEVDSVNDVKVMTIAEIYEEAEK